MDPAAVSSPPGESTFDEVDEALRALRNGGVVVVVDDENRENEGDLVMAAEHASREAMAFIVRHSSGFICVAMPAAHADALDLPPMVATSSNADRMRTAYAVTVDARVGVTTGISAADRARTAQMLADPRCVPADLTRPGHVVPLRARDNGVLERAGHTEATVDLCRLAGLRPVGILCEVVNDDGTMARRPDLFAFARQHRLPVITIGQLVDYRQRVEAPAVAGATCLLPTPHGPFTTHVYAGAGGAEHLALVYGNPAAAHPAPPLVRVHSECLTGEVLGSLRCDCGAQLNESLMLIAQAGAGVLVYLRGHEGRGIGLGAKIAAYALQDQGMDTVDANIALGLPADARTYHDAVAILKDLGLNRVRLLTNNPDKCAALTAAGIDIVEQVPTAPAVTPDNLAYLKTKNQRMGHRITGVDHIDDRWARIS
jgi:3,4-dihydroxy 2-butanone 4-phosphate synthase/GTP cyclohydrolase II